MFVKKNYVIRSVNYIYVIYRQNENSFCGELNHCLCPELIIWLICNFIIFAKLYSSRIQEAVLNAQEQ
jgi:hypothetical protein